MVSQYYETYAAWQRDPLNFWAEAAKGIDWIQAPQNIFDAKAGVYGRWFPDATCNTCWNALDRHVLAGHGARIAYIYDSPLSGMKRKFSYSDTLLEVATLAAVLQDFGVGKGGTRQETGAFDTPMELVTPQVDEDGIGRLPRGIDQ